MSTTGAVLIVVIIAIVLLAVVAYAGARKRRSRGLQERFGPEYERTQERLGSRREAERHLTDVADRRERIEVRPLTPGERERYQQEWTRIQATFVDLPAEAVAEADLLVSRVMRDRGYPVDDFEERADMVAVDHPDVVEHYRFAHAVRARQSQGAVDTETLRSALVHYRALADHLLDPRQVIDLRQDAAQTGHPAVPQAPGQTAPGQQSAVQQPAGQPTGQPGRPPTMQPPTMQPPPPQQGEGQHRAP